jgi:hypothetical protein
MSPQFYTRLYDAVIEQIRQVSPHMKFILDFLFEIEEEHS